MNEELKYLVWIQMYRQGSVAIAVKYELIPIITNNLVTFKVIYLSTEIFESFYCILGVNRGHISNNFGKYKGK